METLGPSLKLYKGNIGFCLSMQTSPEQRWLWQLLFGSGVGFCWRQEARALPGVGWSGQAPTLSFLTYSFIWFLHWVATKFAIQATGGNPVLPLGTPGQPWGVRGSLSLSLSKA